MVATTGEIKLTQMIMVVVVTLGLFAIITLAAKHIKEIKSAVSANSFYTLSFFCLMAACAILYKVGINIMYSAFIVDMLLNRCLERITKRGQE